MMLEGDIMLSEGDQRPVMEHPPEPASGLTLIDWVERILKSGKGAKLDFKNLAAVKPSLQILEKVWEPGIPLVINADIHKGPGWERGATPPLNADLFLKLYSIYHNRHNQNSILSIGWATGPLDKRGYSEKMISKMLNVANSQSGAVTFPIRAYYIKQSWDRIKRLLEGNRFTG
jgi:hypothetical protein